MRNAERWLGSGTIDLAAAATRKESSQKGAKTKTGQRDRKSFFPIGASLTNFLLRSFLPIAPSNFSSDFKYSDLRALENSSRSFEQDLCFFSWRKLVRKPETLLRHTRIYQPPNVSSLIPQHCDSGWRCEIVIGYDIRSNMKPFTAVVYTAIDDDKFTVQLHLGDEFEAIPAAFSDVLRIAAQMINRPTNTILVGAFVGDAQIEYEWGVGQDLDRQFILEWVLEGDSIGELHCQDSRRSDRPPALSIMYPRRRPREGNLKDLTFSILTLFRSNGFEYSRSLPLVAWPGDVPVCLWIVPEEGKQYVNRYTVVITYGTEICGPFSSQVFLCVINAGIAYAAVIVTKFGADELFATSHSHKVKIGDGLYYGFLGVNAFHNLALTGLIGM
ncbi:hypothetical protein D9757_004457 [Collybiopsis confluens]|uniref:Uncharacterized protein n=1 Tax=Collybiopsis confluens TaxID=2823264 RepID=A0A8H5MEB3_9AGAR|nr:hypothetical protein D9757_004457 [Collybiopsis confluens]